MASAWGNSFVYWGSAWGSVSDSVIVDPGISITNSNATTSVPVNYLICSRTGFRVSVKEGLVKDGYGEMVRKESADSRHPQDMVRSRPERQQGSIRPEPEDNFIDSISDGSTL